MFSAATLLSLIPSVGPSPNNKKLFFQLSVWDDKLLLSIPKITILLGKPLPKFHEPFPPNAIP